MKQAVLNTKVSDIIEHLNKLVEPINGMKGDHSLFHNNVISCINPYLNELGLKSITWRIVFWYEHKYIELFTYGRSFDKDKRTITHEKGVFGDIKFSLTTTLDNSHSITLLEYMQHLIVADIDRNISEYIQIIEEKQTDILKSKEAIAQLELNRDTLLKKTMEDILNEASDVNS